MLLCVTRSQATGGCKHQCKVFASLLVPSLTVCHSLSPANKEEVWIVGPTEAFAGDRPCRYSRSMMDFCNRLKEIEWKAILRLATTFQHLSMDD